MLQYFKNRIKDTFGIRCVHRCATEILMDLIEETGLVTYVGKTNMDRSAPDELVEESADMCGGIKEKYVQGNKII